MRNNSAGKRNDNKGLSRLTAVLILLVAVLLIVTIVPFVIKYNGMGSTVACASALDTARRQLAADYMFNGENGTAEEAKEYVGYVMAGWDDLCPAGGTTYIVRREDGSELDWDVVCGLHGSDRKQCTRLNADYVLEQLRHALMLSQLEGTEYPETITVTLHSKPLTANLVYEDTGIRRGTSATIGVEGTVVSYAIAGYSDFGTGRGAEEGEISWFSYADEEHCANWSVWNGWSGDSYAAS